MKIEYPELGVCGLNCKFCPRYMSQAESRCSGCKTESRMSAGCPFITCAVKHKEIEFCWDCAEKTGCRKWADHREAGKQFDSFKCYQKLEDDIRFVEMHGLKDYLKLSDEKSALLKQMVDGYNDGRSMNLFCIAATVFEAAELRGALDEAAGVNRETEDLKARNKSMRSILKRIADQRGYRLELRK